MRNVSELITFNILSMKKNNLFFSYLIAIFLFSFAPNSVYASSCERDSTEHDFFIEQLAIDALWGYYRAYICVNICTPRYKCSPHFFKNIDYRHHINFGDDIGDFYCDSIFAIHLTRLLEKDTLYMSDSDYDKGDYIGISTEDLDNCFNGLTLLEVVELYFDEDGFFKTEIPYFEELTVLCYLYKNHFYIGQNHVSGEWHITDMFCKTNYLKHNFFIQKKYCK